MGRIDMNGRLRIRPSPAPRALTPATVGDIFANTVASGKPDTDSQQNDDEI